MKRSEIEGLLEALLFIESEPIGESVLQKQLGVDKASLHEALSHLEAAYNEDNSGIQLISIGDSWQLRTNPNYFEPLEELIKAERVKPLSEASLEVLSVIAYTQPCSRDTVRSIRGVNSDSIMSNLISKGLVKEVGKADPPSNARLYGTTSLFLEHFGLASISDLPSLESYSANEHDKAFIKSQLEKHVDAQPTTGAMTPEDE